MDSYREHPSDFEPGSSEGTQSANDVTAAIGTDERRMHVRAYNHWVSLLDGRDFPSIEDLEPANVEDFAAHSVLLDFTCGGDNPAIPYVGASIREECGLNDDMRTISDVPSRSLLSRLTDHYMQIIANRAPVGFEAEFDNPRGESICYRGILMPFSSDGEAIDFIYGVINWKRVDEAAGRRPSAEILGIESSVLPLEPLDEGEPEFSADAEEPLELTEAVAGAVEQDQPVAGQFDAEGEQPVADVFEVEEDAPVADRFEAEEDQPVADEFAADEGQPGDHDFEVPAEPQEFIVDAESPVFQSQEAADIMSPVLQSWEDGPLADEDALALPEIVLGDDAGLADRLWAARETAESVKAGEGRTRSALYKALSLAYDFAVAAQENPQEYAELLEESGVKAQARAPMTPIVKLVFGIDYDKARLTEFAAALAFAQRQQVALGAFQDLIEKQPGGLKALVAAERQARRPEAKADSKGEVARAALRSAPPISLADVPVEEEFAVVVTRRGPDGTHEVVAIVEDEALVERAIRRAA